MSTCDVLFLFTYAIMESVLAQVLVLTQVLVYVMISGLQ